MFFFGLFYIFSINQSCQISVTQWAPSWTVGSTASQGDGIRDGTKKKVAQDADLDGQLSPVFVWLSAKQKKISNNGDSH